MAVVLATTAIAQPVTNRPQPATGLELIAAETELEVKRPEGQPAILNLHTYVAARKAAFEIHVRRVGDEYRIQRVIRDGNGTIEQIIDLPDDVSIDPYGGISDFFVITAENQDGEVATTSGSFCPTAWGKARVADRGPDSNVYPHYCEMSPVSQAVVWGIEQGWASPGPDPWTVELDVPDGAYELTVEIAPRYRRLFSIAPGKAVATMQLRVETGSEPHPMSFGPVDPHDPSHDQPSLGIDPPQVRPGADGLPDLIALPAHALMATHDELTGRDYLAFGATVWNGGDGPLVVEGFRSAGRATMTAYQYFYDNGVRTGRAQAGTFVYDSQEGHDHWHFADFAQYRLLDAAGSEVVRSAKEACCLAPTDALDLTLPTANWHPYSHGLVTSCGSQGAIWIRQILDVGWGDTYHQWLPGQSLDITDLPNGEYVIEITANAEDRLRETRTDNNIARLHVNLGGEPGIRTVEAVAS